MMRVLVVDDDRFLAESMTRLLTQHGYTAETVAQASDALRVVKAAPPELVILDLGLPDQDGVSLCRKMREFLEAPILMLTSRSDSIDKVIGLEAGADDYLTKPFDPHELVARVRALMRRSQGGIVTGEKATRVAGLIELDESGRHVSVAGNSLVLTNTEFQMLSYLMANSGRAVSREQLFETVWGYDLKFSSNSLEVLMYRLRAKIAKAGGGEVIQTLRGFGYKFEA